MDPWIYALSEIVESAIISHLRLRSFTLRKSSRSSTSSLITRKRTILRYPIITGEDPLSLLGRISSERVVSLARALCVPGTSVKIKFHKISNLLSLFFNSEHISGSGDLSQAVNRCTEHFDELIDVNKVLCTGLKCRYRSLGDHFTEGTLCNLCIRIHFLK